MVAGSGFSVSVEVPTRVVWAAVESVRLVLGLRRGRPGVAALVGDRVSGRLLLVGSVGSVVVEVPVGACGVDRVVPVDVLGLREAVRGHQRRGGTRLVLAQARLRLAGGWLGLAATDRYRLAVDEVGLIGDASASWDALVSARWLEVAAQRLARTGAGPVQVGLDRAGRLCLADESGLRLAHPTSPERFPDVDQVMVRTYRWQVSVDRDGLLAALSTVAPDSSRARSSLAPVALTVAGDTVTVTRSSEDASTTATATLIATVTPAADGHRVGANPAFLRDALRHQPTTEVELRLPEDPLAPMLLGTPDGGYRHLLMPVRLPT